MNIFLQAKEQFNLWQESFKDKDVTTIKIKALCSSPVTGYYGHQLAGPWGAAAGGALPLAFYATSKNDRKWFSLSTPRPSSLKIVFLARLTHAAVALLTKSKLPGQVEHYRIIRETSLGTLLLLWGVLGPAAEEILFRGLIMDLIATARPKWQKISRIALQSLLFGALHYKAAQGASNFQIVADTALFGMTAGYLMEESSNIAEPFLYHAACNTAAVFWCKYKSF